MLASGLVLAVALLPFDGAISRTLVSIRPTGDFRRELELAQQFGGPATMLIVSLLIWRLDPGRTRRLLDWAAAAALTSIAIFALKVTLGRPRPKFIGEHLNFLGPWSTHIVQEGDPPRHAWEFWADDVTEIWSMPSSHTALAVVAGVFLSRMYPRLTPMMVALALLVAFCRVLFKAHYASDTIVGAAIAYVIANTCVRGYWGVRAIDACWVRLIDRNAAPALPDLLARERRLDR